MARRRTATLLAIGIPVALVALVVAAWAVDMGISGGEVVRNTALAERAVGGSTEGDLVPVAEAVAADYADVAVRIDTPEQVYETTAGELGLQLVTDTTVDKALEVGRDGPIHERFGGWLASFASTRSVPTSFTIDDATLSAELVELQGEARVQPVEPVLVGGSSPIVGIRGGVPGTSLDAGTVGDALIEAAETGAQPIVVDARPVPRAPRFSDEEARALAEEATALTAETLQVSAGGESAGINPALQRSWISSVPSEQSLELAIDAEKVIVDLAVRLPGTDVEAQSAAFTVEAEVPRIIPGITGTTCCAPGTGEVVLDALVDGQASVEVPLIEEEPELTTAEAEALGIREKVGAQGEWAGRPFDREFTTYFEPGQDRVINIHRFADLMRGALIPPGESLSLNDHVGRRTREKGFVPGGFISDGEIVDDVGGGISQFATTIFNAAFFAGLTYGEYQSHSLVIDRYPYGREATISFPAPDLVIENPSPYGVLVWTSFTDSSVTVTLYSTPWAIGAETGQSTSPVGPCTRVTTERTRTFVADGTTEVDDVTALYRPGEGVDC